MVPLRLPPGRGQPWFPRTLAPFPAAGPGTARAGATAGPASNPASRRGGEVILPGTHWTAARQPGSGQDRPSGTQHSDLYSPAAARPESGDHAYRRCRAALAGAGATVISSRQGQVTAALVRAACDAELADRIRFLTGTGPGVTERKMSGRLAFLAGGNMAISASGQGGALVRVDPAESGALAATANATVAVTGGRTMPGWPRVSAGDPETGEQLTERVNRAAGYARPLPPKR
jgi:hypothetical protein